VERKSRILAVAATLAVLAGQLTWAVGDGSSAPTANIHPTETLSDTSERLVEVTVTAHRAKLTPRVTKFVNQIAARGNEEGLPRWQKPVCPFVSGLPRPDAEFILARVSEIAREAGVPVGGENCRPNLYILIHPQPQQLLPAMAKRNFIYTFGQDAYPTVVDAFIATPRPARVWYNVVERFAIFGPGYASRLRYRYEWELTHVFVVVDQTRLQAVSRGQLADYVALVSLAQLKPDARRRWRPPV